MYYPPDDLNKCVYVYVLRVRAFMYAWMYTMSQTCDYFVLLNFDTQM